MQFFKADTTALFPEGDAERRDVLSPLVTQAFIVVLFLDLRHCRLTCAFHARQRRRILHLDDHARVRILRLDENIAEAFSGFHVGQNQPVRLAPEKPQQQAVIEVFLLIVLGLRVQDADHLAKDDRQPPLNLFGVAVQKRLTERLHGFLVPDDGVLEPFLNLEYEHLPHLAVGDNQLIYAALDAPRLRQIPRRKQHAPQVVDAVVDLAVGQLQPNCLLNGLPGNEPLDLILRELDEFCQNGPAPDELSRCREQVKTTLLMGLENTGNRMMAIGRSELLRGEVSKIEEVLDSYDSVTADDILNLARRVFDRSKASLAVVGQPDSEDTYRELLR